MTGTIEDGFHLSDDADPLRQYEDLIRQEDDFREITEAAALLEQAKGVLIFRYSIGACTAFRLIERWAGEAGVGIDTVARAMVHDICQGDRSQPSDPRFVRSLEERLRQEFPVEPDGAPRTPPPVTVGVDHSDCSLDAVVEAAREAARRCVHLEVTVAPSSLHGVRREQMMQRIRLAGELARAVAPGVEVRLPEEIGAGES
jgi:ANTAR domain